MLVRKNEPDVTPAACLPALRNLRHEFKASLRYSEKILPQNTKRMKLFHLLEDTWRTGDHYVNRNLRNTKDCLFFLFSYVLRDWN